jgi:hypothetical protein
MHFLAFVFLAMTFWSKDCVITGKKAFLWAWDLWQMWLAHCSGWGTHFIAGLSTWTSYLLAFTHSTASLSFHLIYLKDSPTRLKTFLNQPDVYVVVASLWLSALPFSLIFF